jgi:subtilisin family serine protease
MQANGGNGADGWRPEMGLEIMEEQIRLIETAHPEATFTGPDGTGIRRPGEPFGFIYREGALLARHDIAEQVRDALIARGQRAHLTEHRPLRAASPPIGRGRDIEDTDLDRELRHHAPVVVELPDARPGSSVPELCRSVHEELGADEDGFPPAAPHHYFYMTPVRILCPATEPLEVTDADPTYPPLGAEKGGCDVPVAVLDTGFIRAAADYCAWLRDVVDVDPDPVDAFDTVTMQDHPDHFIDPYAGHGTFITGVIKRIAPAAVMQVRRLDIDLRAAFTDWPSYSADLVDEMHLADHVRAALWSGQQVISLSAGGPTLDGRPPLSFRSLRTLFHESGAVLVAAAGNEGSAEPFWPAALPWVTGVGALDAAGTARASFSNFGVNADVYAPGTGLVNAYARGRYRCVQPPDVGTIRRFDGRARWSGTSFATPVVAGLVAARMSAQSETAPEALAALLATAATSHALGGVGPTLAPEYADLGL